VRYIGLHFPAHPPPAEAPTYVPTYVQKGTKGHKLQFMTGLILHNLRRPDRMEVVRELVLEAKAMELDVAEVGRFRYMERTPCKNRHSMYTMNAAAVEATYTLMIDEMRRIEREKRVAVVPMDVLPIATIEHRRCAPALLQRVSRTTEDGTAADLASYCMRRAVCAHATVDVHADGARTLVLYVLDATHDLYMRVEVTCGDEDVLPRVQLATPHGTTCIDTGDAQMDRAAREDAVRRSFQCRVGFGKGRRKLRFFCALTQLNTRALIADELDDLPRVRGATM